MSFALSADHSGVDLKKSCVSALFTTDHLGGRHGRRFERDWSKAA